tara:strand:- start:864 stop:1424 length:561 start_codon:yes stop_codon:yes gene_type:complete
LDHAPGFQFHLAHYVDSSHVWKAPNGTGYVVGYFTGPNGERTPDFPQAIMDNRNNPVIYEKVTARDLTDTHRRALAACAAFTFGLAWQLWAREEIENPMRDSSSARAESAKPAAKIEGVSDGDQPLFKNDRELCLGLIKELQEDKLASFLADFRRSFGLAENAKVAPALTSKKHQDWMNDNMHKYV